MNPQANPRFTSLFLAFSERASIVVILVGTLVLVGWMLDVVLLKSVLPGLVTMKTNTALAFILAGLSLRLSQLKRSDQQVQRYARWCALGAAGVGLLTLCQYLFGWELGIDQLLFKETADAIATSSPGRMSPNTALNFLLTGSALMLLDSETQGGRWPAQFLTIMAALVALLALTGYLYGASPPPSIAAYTKIAIHTVVAFIVLCTGILFARPDKGVMTVFASEGMAGILARRMMLAAVGIPVMLGWLRLKGQQAGLYEVEFGLSLLVVCTILVFAILIWRTAESIDQTDIERQRAEETLRKTSEEIIERASALSGSVGEIFAAATQLAATAAETATAVNETTTTVEEVKQTAQLSSQKAKNVSDSSQKATQVAQTGRKSVEASVEGMKRIQTQMESIADSIVKLSEQSQAIGEIIATVNDLAEQSNLLAVNAAIEAAKAGEQGKGFAVVAQEIKSLAEQSKQATAQVRNILSDIQKATSAAVMATEQGSKAVDAGMKQSAEAGESIRVLAETITEASQAATQIAASSQQQLVGTDQVALAMENIKQASTQNVAATKQAEQACQNLNDLGQRLRSMIEANRAH